MIIGDKTEFAIESHITHAYECLSFRGLGFFTIHILNHRYGVYAPDATMLACSFDEVQERIARRSTHIASFAEEPDGGKIADAFRDAIYAPDQENNRFLRISRAEHASVFYSNHLVWAPDGDEAFDDGSYILQFDIGNVVRLIGFRTCEDCYHHNPRALRDVRIDADSFYRVLQDWRDAFHAEWLVAPKVPES